MYKKGIPRKSSYLNNCDCNYQARYNKKNVHEINNCVFVSKDIYVCAARAMSFMTSPKS